MSLFRLNWSLRLFSFFKIPLLFYVRPRIIRCDRSGCEIILPLRRNRNHLNSMYLGALCTGADCVVGLLALQPIRESGREVNLVLKDLKGDFLKRPMADVHFTCNDGEAIFKQLEKTFASGERVEQVVTAVATTPTLSGSEPVAQFKITLSMRAKKTN